MNDRTASKRLKQSSGLVWILPAFLFLVIIIYYSIFFTFNLSTLDWDGLSPVQTRVGLANFAKMFRDAGVMLEV